jgi:MBG domain (YGX type)
MLVIVANSFTAIAGQPLPPLTASYFGFVNGDSAASLASPAIVTTTASASSSYPITVQGASWPNYAIMEVPGNITIPAVPATLVSMSIQAVKLANQDTVRAIVLVWNAALNPADALRITIFELSTIPDDSKEHSESIAIAQILYTPGANTLTIVTQDKLKLNNTTQLTIESSGLEDAAGDFVNSSTPSQPGPNITVRIE